MYLLDTNICIYYLKHRYGMDRKIESIGLDLCAISELTIAELKYGAAKSETPSKNLLLLQELMEKMEVLPIFSCFDVYASQKNRLRKMGQIIDDFDLLIGSTAIANDLILVTNNEKHFTRLEGIRVENWIVT